MLQTKSEPPPVAGERVEVSPDFDTYVAGQWGPLCRLAYLATGNRHDAEDAVQDALAGLYPRWQRVRAKGDPGAYLRRSISNANITRWRRARKTVLYADLEAHIPQNSDATEPIADEIVLAGLLRRLTRRQRVIVGLRYLDDRSYADIAAICGCTPAAARSVVRYALALMKAATSGDTL